jgi:5-methyltetrahydrofolate--homocysteine methyltransferase
MPMSTASAPPRTLDRGDRTDELRELMAERILVLDGATGTMLQSKNLRSDDFGGAELDGCNEVLVATRPDVILDVHRAYLEAGADVIETNTFGGTPLVLAEYRLAHRALELNRRAAEIARRAADEFTTPTKPRFVAGSVGPTTKSISVTGGVTFGELVDTFTEQARGLLQGGVDLFLVETCQDTRNTKAALLAIDSVLAASGCRRPVAVSGTIEPMGTMLAGQTAEAFTVSLAHAELLFLGLNCATGPEFMTDHLRSIHELAACAVSCYPNAGLPDENGGYPETPESLARQLDRFAANGWLNLVGGCCGTTDAHIRALAEMAQSHVPRRVPGRRPDRVFFSGIDVVEASDEARPLLVGERTNVIGSRAFKRLVEDERWDDAAAIARRQVRGGAHIVDVCLQSTERDELADIAAFYDHLTRSIKAPLMIDTTDPEAVELALSYSQGRAIVNSINLEDGEARFRAVVPLLLRYGAAVVVGTIDEDPEQAQAFSRERKLEVARRSYELLTGSYGLAPQDLVFDPLVFPAASGDEAYIGGAVETLEGLRLIREAFPSSRTILGISNVSFGLPVAAREVVNSVFLYLATRAGLDLAIVNTERIERYASIPENERRMAEALLTNAPPGEDEVPDHHASRDLLLGAPADWREQSSEQRVAVNRFHIERLAAYFRGGERRQGPATVQLPLDERLARYIIEGTRDGLLADLDAKLAEGTAPLDVINGPLMAGMAEVGRLFNANELIVAEVLQSAESMKAAVAHLEPHMDADDATSRGRVLLATVKGDVHDIGKNLVEIIFRNNGYEVVNLGIKVPPEAIIQAAREHRPDAIGLSGLLVKSAHQMVVTVEDLAAAGVDVPVLVGGAALSEKFTRTRIAPVYSPGAIYCADAMSGLDVINRLMDSGLRVQVLDAARGDATPAEPETPTASPVVRPRRSPRVRTDVEPIPPPQTDRRVLDPVPHLREIWKYVNPQMLYGKHLGLKGSFEKRLAEHDATALELQRVVEDLLEDVVGWMRVRAVWRFFEADSDGDQLRLFLPSGSQPAHVFRFPRQPKQDGLCLADYAMPPRDGRRDSVAAFVVTAGHGVRERAERSKEAGEYLRSHALQALALETAEGAAEWLHRRIRELWGFPDPPETTMKDRFAARYRGKRYSFGYPACPDLDDQAALWRLLEPDEIDVRLTEGMMMEPEASVSALVFHHPDASYFSAAGVQR